MSLSELKFEESDFEGQDIASLDDRPKISAAELKARFDNIGKALLALGRFNQLLDSLISGEALADIKVVLDGEEKSLQELLAEYRQELSGVEGLQDELNKLTEEVEKLSDVPANMESLQKELDELTEDVEKLSESHPGMEGMQGDLDEYQQRLEAAEQEVAGLHERIDRLEDMEGEIVTDLNISAHFTNSDIHITAEEREKWDGKLSADQRGAAGGVASLDEDGKIPEEQLPEISSVTIRRW